MLSKLLDFFYRIYRVSVRLIIKHSSNPRPSSHPYITGDGFRAIADHIYDDYHPKINSNEIKKGDIIFVGDSRIKKFLHEVHPHVPKQYILISHNGDEAIDEVLVKMIDEKIIKWYGINVTTFHPKVIPIPLGLGNKHYYVTGIPSIFRNIAKKNYPKNNKIFYGFTTSTNVEEREPALLALKRNQYAETLKKWKNFPNYMKLLATYKFVASPPGSSVEGHRTWEALYIGVIPIVKSSITMNYFKSLNMPLWVVKDWNELDIVNEKLINNTFEMLMNTHSKEVLYIDYWIDKIRSHKI